VHMDDAVTVLERAVLEDHPGIYNVAGAGILYLSQAVRMSGRPMLPVPLPLLNGLGEAARRVGGIDFSPEQLRFLLYGRVGDTARLHAMFGYEPKHSTVDGFREFLADRIHPLLDGATLDRVERDLGGALSQVRHALRATQRGLRPS
jgi:UDP-glucose 4-epimerase